MLGGALSPGLIFLVQALVIVALPVAILRFSRLKGRLPLVVVQIVVGLALGPSLFGRLAPTATNCFSMKRLWRPCRASALSQYWYSA
jgi:hypothetical protein